MTDWLEKIDSDFSRFCRYKQNIHGKTINKCGVGLSG